MKLRLQYIVPEANEHTDAGINTEMEGFTDWLEHMIRTNPDTNFFFVTDSTDIFADDPPEEAEDYSRLYNASNHNWTSDPQLNFLFLKGVQAHMNNTLQARGHVFLNDVYDALRMPRSIRGQVVGWAVDSEGDGYVDFGLYSDDPAMVSFRNGETPNCLLEFNIDGVVVDYLEKEKLS